MLTMTDDLRTLSMSAGEPFMLEVQLKDKDGAVVDPSARAFVLSFFLGGADAGKAISGELLEDETGKFFRFVRSGTFFATAGGSTYSAEMAERFREGRNVAARGVLTVAPSAPGVASLDNGMIGRFVTRITIRDAATLGEAPVFSQAKRIYRADLGTPLPRFTTLPSLSHDGTPQVGEQIGGNDGVVTNGAVSARQWLLNGTAITGATGGAYVPVPADVGKALAFRVTAAGGGVDVVEVTAAVLVAAAAGSTPTPTPTPSPTPPATTTPGTFAMAQLAESRSYQRTNTAGGAANKGTGSVSVPLSVSQAGSIYARQRRADGTIIAAAWLAIANQAATSGEQAVVIPGVSAVSDLFYLDLSPSGSGSWQLGTTLIGMTDIDAMVGQSLQVANAVAAYDSTTMATQGVTIDPRTRVRFTLTDFTTHSDANTRWQAPSDTGLYTSAFMGEYGRLIAAAQGMPAGIVGHAQGARSLSSFLPGGDNAAAFALALDRSGGFARLHVNCGHSDAAAGQTYADRKAKLTQLRQYAAAHNLAQGDDFVMYVESFPYIVGDAWGTPAQRNTIRKADLDFCADPANRAVYIGTVDQTVADGVHQDNPGARTFGRSYYRAVRPSLGLAHGNEGARLLSGSRIGEAIVLPVAYVNGGTALSTDGANVGRRYRFFAEGDFTAPLGLDATTPFTIAANGSSITVNLAADPGPDAVLHFYFAPPWYDPAGGIYDNVVDGDGLTRGRHVQANPYPVIIPAPSGAGAPVFSIGAASVEDQAVPQYSIGAASVETV